MRHRLLRQQLVWTFAAAVLVGLLSAANSGPITKLKLDPAAEVVPLFEGRDDGRFEVRMSATNAYQANVVIVNKAETPLTVALPKAAVGVHVLPQFNGPNGFFPNNNQGNNAGQQGPNGNMAAIGNTAQTVGGPMQTTGIINQGGGPTANPFGFPSVPAEWADKPEFASFAGFATVPAGKSIQLRMRTVCLDHGRPVPMPRLTYRLMPVEDYTTDPILAELLERYSPRTDQEVMQAAAWHVANGLSWDKLATLSNNGVVTTFNRRQVNDAKALVESVETAAKSRPQTKVADVGRE